MPRNQTTLPLRQGLTDSPSAGARLKIEHLGEPRPQVGPPPGSSAPDLEAQSSAHHPPACALVSLVTSVALPSPGHWWAQLFLSLRGFPFALTRIFSTRIPGPWECMGRRLGLNPRKLESKCEGTKTTQELPNRVPASCVPKEHPFPLGLKGPDPGTLHT